MALSSIFWPDEFRDAIYAVDLERLAGMGIRVVYLDIDNTLLPFGSRRPSLKCEQWILRLKNLNMKPIILSNNRNLRRVAEVADGLGIPAVCWSMKPLPWALRSIQRELGLEGQPSAIIGDQVLTDVILGKTQGLYTILVKPIRLDNKPTKAFQYQFEQMLLQFFRPTTTAR